MCGKMSQSPIKCAMSSPLPFDQAWTLADTAHYLALPEFPKDGSAAEQDTWRREVSGPADRKLALALGRHMAEKMQEGKQVLPPFCEHVNVPVVNALRELEADRENAQAQESAGDHLVREMRVFSALHPFDKDALPEDVHAKLLRVIDEGVFKFSASNHGVCMSSGERIDILFDGWEAQAGRGTYTPLPGSWRSDYTFAPLTEEDISSPQVESVSIPVPSGEIWIADWFRIPAFHALGEKLDNDPNGPNISAIGGRTEQMRRYAETLGVAHIPCKSPDLTQDESIIMGGYLDIDQEDPKNFAGRISANLRWTTIVDKRHLVSLLGLTLGEEEALRQVSEYEASSEGKDLIKLQVKPGFLHIYAAGAVGLFGKIEEQFDTSGLNLSQFEHPAFVLSETPLSPVSKLTRKTPRP